jgi:hypothetical protein
MGIKSFAAFKGIWPRMICTIFVNSLDLLNFKHSMYDLAGFFGEAVMKPVSMKMTMKIVKIVETQKYDISQTHTRFFE